jgi:hypothetical protein
VIYVSGTLLVYCLLFSDKNHQLLHSWGYVHVQNKGSLLMPLSKVVDLLSTLLV